MNIMDMDLNLLVVLDALLEEGNVTKAAARVGLSQPAMSNALARLREKFGDPLFVRTPGGMIPTARARALTEPVRLALRAIGAALAPGPIFDPAQSSQVFTIATTDYAELVLLPELSARFRESAPGVKLDLRSPRERVPQRELEAGQLDVAIGLFPDAPASFYRQTLFVEDFVCILRKDHPLRGKLTLEKYAALRHALISPFGGMTGTVDEALEKHGLKREVVVATPHFLVAPLVVVRTDYILTLPRRVAASLASYLPVRLVEPPLELSKFTISQLWHERTHHDPAHRWFRAQLASL